MRETLGIICIQRLIEGEVTFGLPIPEPESIPVAAS